MATWMGSMPDLSTTDVVLITLAVIYTAIGVWSRIRNQRQRRYCLPPGPKGYPIVGNLFQIPKVTDKSWEIFAQWSERYGKIISLNVPGRCLIVINDLKVANEMLDKNGSIYSERPQSVMLSLSGYARFTLTLPYNRDLKEQRKLIARAIGTPSYMKRFYPKYERHACLFLERIISSPKELTSIANKTTGAIQLDLAYGYRMKDDEDPLVALLESTAWYFARIGLPGYFIVDYIPALRYLPRWVPVVNRFRKFAEKAKKLVEDLVQDPFDNVLRAMATGTSRPSLVSDVLSKVELTPSQTVNLKWAANIFYAAGSGTMAVMIRMYFFAMAANPEIQTRVHEEMDRVVGSQRLPSFDDRASLPYLQAVVKEIFRWYAAAPLGLIHVSSEDDVQDGYFIPKGSYVIVNIWKLLHDPEYYADPFEFNPQRFLGSNPELDPYKVCFGFGRRICAGMHAADAFVWIVIAMSAATLHISKAKGEDGKFIEPVMEQMPGVVSRPAPFECNIVARHESVMMLVEQSIAEGM